MSTPAALAFALIASRWFVSAAADRPSERGAAGPVFSVHDLDRDGFIDRREYYQFRQRLHPRPGAHRQRGRLHAFDDFDRDADGRISRDELVDTLGSANPHR